MCFFFFYIDRKGYWVFFFFSSRRRHTRCGRDWSSDVCSSDLATEQAALQVRIRRVGAKPDGQKGGREVIARDRALSRAVHVHLDTGTRRVDEGQPLAALHIHHPALELLDALVQRGELRLGVVLKALLPGLLELIVADVVHEGED